jgi:hypothetical protein
MFRTILVVCLTGLIFFAACTGANQPQQTPQNQGTDLRGNTGAVNPGSTETNGGERINTPPTAADDQGRTAQRLIRQGDFETAINILEDMSAKAPLSDEMKGLLVQSHLGYAKTITLYPGLTPQLLNDTLYSHYMRVLALDPQNAEAQAGIASLRTYYNSSGLTPPAEVNPLAFVPQPDGNSANSEQASQDNQSSDSDSSDEGESEDSEESSDSSGESTGE